MPTAITTLNLSYAGMGVCRQDAMMWGEVLVLSLHALGV